MTMIVNEVKSTLPKLGSPDTIPIESPRYGTLKLKRATDLAVGSLLALLAIPVTVAAMILVRLTSRGPAIYTQVRLGRGNRPYTIYKIRSMVLDCESETGPRWSTKGDSRITPVGRILRSTHIDELPQLWNVLRGEMSLVGPRPERPAIAAELALVIPCYGDRMQLRPGMTGLAQVQLPPDACLADVKRKLACDLYYIRHADFWLDLRILLSTASYVMGIPFNATRALLRVPSGEIVEAAYRSRSDAAARMQAV
jgi:lipopolysaccharide/colanic/teichoic acid biosynthesis glycosyltransferase